MFNIQMHARNPDAIHHGTQSLSRFSELHAALPKNPVERSGVIQGAKSIIAESGYRSSLGHSAEEKEALLSKIHRLNPNILSAYERDIPYDVFIKTFLKDLDTVRYFQCAVSSLGYNGPTLLVSYVRRNSVTSSDWIQKSVIKWTPELEYSSTQLFKIFFRAAGDASCRVPECSFIDLDKRRHLGVNGEKHEISLELSDSLRQDLRKIACFNGCFPSDYNQVMLSEKITGANLRDFITENYADLSMDQKKSLFYGIGKISFLDIQVGNLDRIPQVERGFKGLVVGPIAPSNLGNLMIRVSTDPKKPLIVYAIDNNVHVEKEDAAAYQGFLAGFLQKRFKEDILSRNIANSISASFKIRSSPFYHDLTVREKVSPQEIAALDKIIDKAKKTKDQNIRNPSTPVSFSGIEKPKKGYVKSLSAHRDNLVKQFEADDHGRKTRNINTFLEDLDSFGRKEVSNGIVQMEKNIKDKKLEEPLPFEGDSLRIIEQRIKISREKL